MRKFRKVLVSIALAVSMSLFATEAAWADAGSDEATFVSLINASRAASGMGALVMDPSLSDIARGHSSQMATAGNIFHTADLAHATPGGWQTLGENVGMGPRVDTLHEAFMQSPGHRANVLGAYDKVGIGIVYGGDTIFVTELFWKTRVISAASTGTIAAAKACRSRACRARVRRAKIRARSAKIRARRARSRRR